MADNTRPQSESGRIAAALLVAAVTVYHAQRVLCV